MSNQPPENQWSGNPQLPPQGQPFKPGIFVPQAPPQVDGPPPAPVQPAGQPIEYPTSPAPSQPDESTPSQPVEPAPPAPMPTQYDTVPIPSQGDTAPAHGFTPQPGVQTPAPATPPPPAGYAPAPYPDRPGNTGAPQQAEQWDDRSHDKGRKKLLIAVIAVLVFLLGGGAAWWGYTSYQTKQAERIAAENKANAEKQAGEKATEFLTAVSEGRAKDAQAMVAEKPEKADLLTNEALAAAQKKAPISDVGVVKSEGNVRHVLVTVKYSVGGEETSSEFEMVRNNDTDPFQLKDAYGEVGIDGPPGVPVTLNGIPVQSGDTVPVLFGTWELAGTSKYVTVTPSNSAAFTRFPDDGSSSLVAQADAALSPSGKTLFLNQLGGHVNSCATKKHLAPAGCPWRLYEAKGLKIDTKTIKYTIKDPKYLSKTRVALAPGRNNVAQATISVPITITARATQGGRSGTVNTTFSATGKYEMDLSSRNPTIKLLR